MLKLLGCSRLTGLRLTSAMALPFCRQAPPSACNPQIQHDDTCHSEASAEESHVKEIFRFAQDDKPYLRKLLSALVP